MIQLFSNDIINEMNSDTPRIVMAVEILYKNAPVRAHTGFGDKVIDGQVYRGVGALGEIDAIPQTSKTSPSQLRLLISGLDPTLVAETLNTRTQGSKVKVMVCSLDDNDDISSASIVFSGRVSTQRFSYDQQMAVEVEVVDRLADWQRKGALRFDYESHKSRNDGDEFFVYLAQMSSKPIHWGSKKDAPGFRYDK